MVVHGVARPIAVAVADRAVDLPMHLCGFFQVGSISDGLPPHIEQNGGNHIHERRQDAIPRSGGHGLMESHVVDEELFRLVERGIHSRDLLGHRSHLIASRPFSGESGDRHLERLSCLEHLRRRESVQGSHQAEWTAVERRRLVGLNDERSGSLTRLQHAHCGERANSRPQSGTADAKDLGKIPFRWQAIAGPQLAAMDHVTQLLDHPFRSRLVPLGINRFKNLRFRSSHSSARLTPLLPGYSFYLTTASGRPSPTFLRPISVTSFPLMRTFRNSRPWTFFTILPLATLLNVQSSSRTL